MQLSCIIFERYYIISVFIIDHFIEKEGFKQN